MYKYVYTLGTTQISFADPYKVCLECSAWVDGVQELPGEMDANLPCGHQADYDSVCPSWGPVDGCQCQERLGRRNHPLRAQCPEGKVP